MAKKDKQVKKPKDKKENVGLARKIKATTSELKKVTWPTFGEVVKQTGTVLAFVMFFTVVLLGMNYLMQLLFTLFTSAL